MKIKKIILEDGSEFEVKTFEEIKTENPDLNYFTIWKKYNKQFNNVLDTIGEEYCKDYFDLIYQDECECMCENDISDFNDDEIEEEYNSRKITNISLLEQSIRNDFEELLRNTNIFKLQELLNSLK